MPFLADNYLCTGCGSCVNVCPVKCIHLEKDRYGFSYPVVDDTSKCISCRKCLYHCPVQSSNPVNANETLAFAAQSKNDALRMSSSSGGIFSEIASEILKNKGIVYGACYDAEFNVYHLGVNHEEDLSLLRGAKYTESWLGNTFIDVHQKLMEGRTVLFSGTPCQVEGLLGFLGEDFDNLICIDFICHGVPSPMAWLEYVKFRAQIDNNGVLPIEINMRDKSTGWSHYSYSNLYKYQKKEFKEISTNNEFMQLFTSNCILRQSCEHCHFKGYDRVSDITLGDFWGIWDILPEIDDNKGTSAVLIHTTKGKRIWNCIMDRIVYKEVTKEQISRQNPSIIDSSIVDHNRNVILKSIYQNGYEKKRKKSQFLVHSKLKNLLSSFRKS